LVITLRYVLAAAIFLPDMPALAYDATPAMLRYAHVMAARYDSDTNATPRPYMFRYVMRFFAMPCRHAAARQDDADLLLLISRHDTASVVMPRYYIFSYDAAPLTLLRYIQLISCIFASRPSCCCCYVTLPRF